MRRQPKNTLGFTLIELLIVVVILSTLAAIVVPQFASSTTSAKVAAAKSSMSAIRSALEVYRTDHDEYPLEAANQAACSGMNAAASETDKMLNALALYSAKDGEVCDVKSDSHPYGPYMRAKTFPANPIDGSNVVEVVDSSTALKLGLTADAGGTGGWKYEPRTGEFIINHPDYDSE